MSDATTVQLYVTSSAVSFCTYLQSATPPIRFKLAVMDGLMVRLHSRKKLASPYIRIYMSPYITISYGICAV